jgi:hypothetical protein
MISYEKANRIAVAWETSKSMPEAMRKAGYKTKDRRNMHKLRRQAEEVLGISLPSLDPARASNLPHTTEKIDVDSATLAIYGDAHFWPNQAAPAFWILLEVLKDLKPGYVIDNGDSFDGSMVSRHAQISFEDLPELKDEYEACLNYMRMIKEVTPNSKHYRNIGNHDLRIEAKLANALPEFNGMPGFTTHEMFPGWEHNYSIAFNDVLMVKHRLYSGVHAAYNNVLKSGMNIATGHTHRLQMRPWTDYRGTRYGIETGTIADPYGPQFSYTEDGLRDWQPGFVVIEIVGEDIYPELVHVRGNKARFRGNEYSV